MEFVRMSIFFIVLLDIVFLADFTQGTTYRYFTSLEDVKCVAEGEPAYMGIIKRRFCSDKKAGKICENDKFCNKDEICVCNTKCQSYRCIKGSRTNEKDNNEKNWTNRNESATANTTIQGTVAVNSSSAIKEDNCFPNPCQNGTCHSTGNNNFTCVCNPGYTGRRCDTKDCLLNCTAPGQCLLASNGTEFCGCSIPGLTGPGCETDINECEHDTICQFGKCNNTIGSFICICQKFYTSTRCDKRIDTCENTDCGNGTCLLDFNKPEGFECSCRAPFTGARCDSIIQDPCTCKNNGVCKYPTRSGSFECECPSGYTGIYCETKITKCNQSCSEEENPYKNCEDSACERSSRNGTCRGECNSLGCLYDGGDCLAPEKKCMYENLCQRLYGDGECNSFCNTQECGYDIDCFQEPQLEPGKLILEVQSTEDYFKKIEKLWERKISKYLNSLVTVQSVKKINLRERVRRSTDNNTSLLQVTMRMDNGKCTKQCFTTEQGARYLALKLANNDLPLPVKVVKITSQPSTEPPKSPAMPPFVIAILVVGSFLLIGVVYKGKTIASRLWRTDDDPGQRQTPIGQEMRNSDEGESPSSKRFKMAPISRMDSTTPFLQLTTTTTTTNNFETALHRAAQYGYANIVGQLLMEGGVDINKRDMNGKTALHIAVSVEHASVFYLLIRNRHISPDLQDNDGNTPLMIGVVNGNIEFVRQLVSLGSRVSIANREGKTALHLAAMYSNRDAAQILIAHNAKVDAQDNQMRTPLYWACKEESTVIAALLIQHYANKSAADVDDVTPLMVAKRQTNHELIMLLSDNTSPHMIPSPLSISGDVVSPYQDIRPKPGRKRPYQGPNNKQYDPLRDMPDWATHPIVPQQQTFNFTNSYTTTGSPFDVPSPGVRVLPSELSPFSDSIPNIMTPPLSWATTSPQSLGGDDEV